ncbi:tandem-type lipoprotein [Staphylococcus pettenkoferi]|nr:tandem-type lipoprotein [Staphylococcus pettenkoferi]
MKEDTNDNVNKKINKFNFFIQYANINKNIKNKKGDYFYNSNLPEFQAAYKLTNKDDIVRSLKQKYNVSYNKAEMNISGSGEPKENKIGNREIEITFKKNKSYFRDAVTYKPTKKSEDN